MSRNTRATFMIVAAGLSLAAIQPASADGGHHGRRDHGRHDGWQRQDMSAGFAAQTSGQGSGSTVNIVQNGNQNGVAVVAQSGGGTTNIAQNGNNNNLTVIQVVGGGRGHGRDHRRYDQGQSN
jgi:hypothetical protein